MVSFFGLRYDDWNFDLLLLFFGKVEFSDKLFFQIQIKKRFVDVFEFGSQCYFLTSAVIGSLHLANFTLVFTKMNIDFFGFYKAMSKDGTAITFIDHSLS